MSGHTSALGIPASCSMTILTMLGLCETALSHLFTPLKVALKPLTDQRPTAWEAADESGHSIATLKSSAPFASVMDPP